MTDDKLNLRDIPPLRRVEDLESEGDAPVVEQPDPGTPAMVGGTPAMGVPPDPENKPRPPEDDELDQLRRG